MQTYSFELPDGMLKLSFFAENGVRVTLSDDGQAPEIGPGRGGFTGAPGERRFLVRFPGEDNLSELHYPASTRLNHPFPAK